MVTTLGWEKQARSVDAINVVCSREISTFPLPYNDFANICKENVQKDAQEATNSGYFLESGKKMLKRRETLHFIHFDTV